MVSRLREPLTSLYTRTYFLKRRIQQGKIGQTPEVLGDLDAITEDAQEMETRMRALEEMADKLEQPREEDQSLRERS
jgi:hypothetical protein